LQYGDVKDIIILKDKVQPAARFLRSCWRFDGIQYIHKSRTNMGAGALCLVVALILAVRGCEGHHRLAGQGLEPAAAATAGAVTA
jgi:hypothetical protein